MTSLGFSLPLRTQKNVSEKHFLDGGGGVKCLLHTLRHPKRQQTPPSRQNKASDKRLELEALCYIKPGSHILSWGRPQAENWPGRPIKHPTHPPLYPSTLFLFFSFCFHCNTNYLHLCYTAAGAWRTSHRRAEKWFSLPMSEVIPFRRQKGWGKKKKE